VIQVSLNHQGGYST